MATDIETTLEEIKDLLETNSVTREDLRCEVEKILESKIGRLERNLLKYESAIQKKIRSMGIDQLKKIEAIVSANQLVIEIMIPPILTLALLAGYSIKNGHKIDGWAMLKDPGAEVSKIFSAPSEIMPGSSIDLSDIKNPRVGQTVATFPVTSNFGHRIPPTIGASAFHKGVDLGTPIGIPVYAIGKLNVNCAYQPQGAGNYARVKYEKMEFVMMHLSECKTGSFNQGQVFAYTGGTGLGTAPHFHFEQYSNGVLEEPTVGYLNGFMSTPSAPVNEVKLAIGNAEGTLDTKGDPTAAWNGHQDPGNAKANQGTFSYQHAAGNPLEADKKQLKKLDEFTKTLDADAKKLGIVLTKFEKINGLDLFNQSEQAAMNYVQNLVKANRDISKARVQGYYRSDNTLDAPGFGNNLNRLVSDQNRRIAAIKNVLK